MSLLSRLSFKFRILLFVSIALVGLAGALTYAEKNAVDAAYEHGTNRANQAAVLAIVARISDDFGGMTNSATEPGELGTLIWDTMPDDLADDHLDSVRAITGLHVTVFNWDAETNEFVRDATTIETGPNQRAVGTELARGSVYDAMIAGDPFIGEADILGHNYVTYYHPVFDSAGNTIAIFFAGYKTETLAADAREALITSILIALAVLSVALLGAFFVVSVSTRPLHRMTQSIKNLAKGALDQEIPYTQRSDEIGQIASSLVELQATMRHAEVLKGENAERSKQAEEKQRQQDFVVAELTRGLSRLGNLNLTEHIESTPDAPFPTDYEGLRTAFNMLVDNLAETVTAIHEVAEEVNRDAREMAGSSADLSGRTESQAATLEQSAAALEQLSESVRSTASNATDAETTTNDNRAVAKQTGEIVENAISAMAAIEESSQKITQIISVIDDIAFQTNLLALNAGVEAARAGEAGRGFAVVASEVRALAQHSSSSAQEIKSLIASSSEHVENGSKLVRNAGDSIGDIITRVDRVAGLVSDIAVSAKEQSIGVTEINSGVRELDSATQRNATMAEEASAASESLTAAADRLTDQLASFQVASTRASTNWAAAAVGDGAMHFEADTANDAEAFAISAPMHRPPKVEAQADADAFRDF